MQQHWECFVQRRPLVSESFHCLHELLWRHILSCRINFFCCVCGLRCGSVCGVGWCVCDLCGWLFFRVGCIKLHSMCFGKLLQQHVECSVQCRQLVCGTFHRLHELLWGHILSQWFNIIDGVCCLRCGSVRGVGRRVRELCFRLLLRRFGCFKLRRLRFR